MNETKAANKNRDKVECALRFLLRYVGFVSMLALVAVFMPYTWMDEIHRYLGMGTLPANPVVGYLARSLSLFYALLGGLLWLLSADPNRYRGVLLYLGFAFIVFGVVMLGIDHVEGMPNFWKHGEGPFVVIFGTAIAWLAGRLHRLPLPGNIGEITRP